MTSCAAANPSCCSSLSCCQTASTSSSQDDVHEVTETAMSQIMPAAAVAAASNGGVAAGAVAVEIGNNNPNGPMLQANNNYYIMREKHQFPKRPEIDLQFRNIGYRVKSWSMKSLRPETKEILHGVSGEFRAGELTAIMGPSGAGKSTLLNVLAGFTVQGMSGEVLINGKLRSPHSERWRRTSCYIQQYSIQRTRLSVGEAMTIAAHLKLGCSMSSAFKHAQVLELLEILGLSHCYDTLCGKLSGGQKKRLDVALELLSNPSVLFLDEPTTGLDSASCSQCISLLQRLAKTEKRTVICTIHQPSALQFEMFDSLYALADGHCIYRGAIPDLVPHLASLGLRCPPYHNPADFLLEVAIGEYGITTDKLMRAVESNEEKRRTIAPAPKPTLPDDDDGNGKKIVVASLQGRSRHRPRCRQRQRRKEGDGGGGGGAGGRAAAHACRLSRPVLSALQASAAQPQARLLPPRRATALPSADRHAVRLSLHGQRLSRQRRAGQLRLSLRLAAAHRLHGQDGRHPGLPAGDADIVARALQSLVPTRPLLPVDAADRGSVPGGLRHHLSRGELLADRPADGARAHTHVSHCQHRGEPLRAGLGILHRRDHSGQDRRIHRSHPRRALLRVRLLHTLRRHAQALPLALLHLVLPRELSQPPHHRVRQQSHPSALRAGGRRHQLLPLQAADAVPQGDGDRPDERRQQYRADRGHRRAHASAHGVGALVQAQSTVDKWWDECLFDLFA